MVDLTLNLGVWGEEKIKMFHQTILVLRVQLGSGPERLKLGVLEWVLLDQSVLKRPAWLVLVRSVSEAWVARK